MNKHKVINKNNSRLDKFLTEIANLSRTKVQSLIKAGYVLVNKRQITDISHKVKLNDHIEFEIKSEAIQPPIPKINPKKLKLDIVYEDKYLAVINKPAGLTIHPGAGNYDNTLVNALLAHYKDALSLVGGHTRPGIIHRLDKNTSGLLIIAKDDITHLKLSKLLQDRKIKRVYHALSWGTPEKMQGTIEINIGRNRQNRKKMSTQATGGKPAITHYKVLKILQKKAISLLECKLETGRTHQIRVHLSHIGHSIIGDPEYGSIRTKRKQALSQKAAEYIKPLERQMLHAKKLSFIHPITNKQIDLEIALPDDMKELIAILLLES